MLASLFNAERVFDIYYIYRDNENTYTQKLKCSKSYICSLFFFASLDSTGILCFHVFLTCYIYKDIKVETYVEIEMKINFKNRISTFQIPIGILCLQLTQTCF